MTLSSSPNLTLYTLKPNPQSQFNSALYATGLADVETERKRVREKERGKERERERETETEREREREREVHAFPCPHALSHTQALPRGESGSVRQTSRGGQAAAVLPSILTLSLYIYKYMYMFICIYVYICT